MFRKLFLGLALCALAVAMFIEPVLAGGSTAFFADAFAAAGIQIAPSLFASPLPYLALVALAVIAVAPVAVVATMMLSLLARRRAGLTPPRIMPTIIRYRPLGPVIGWRAA